MTTVSFSFPDPAARLSLNGRLHWARRAGITSAWRSTAHRYYLRLNNGRGPSARALPPSTVLVTFEVAADRRRDPHNLVPTVKAIIDGLVDAGAWPDDTPDWVTVIDPQFRKGTARVQIDLTPRDSAA